MKTHWSRGEVPPKNIALAGMNGEKRPQGGESWGETILCALGIALCVAMVAGTLYLMGGGSR